MIHSIENVKQLGLYKRGARSQVGHKRPQFKLKMGLVLRWKRLVLFVLRPDYGFWHCLVIKGNRQHKLNTEISLLNDVLMTGTPIDLTTKSKKSTNDDLIFDAVCIECNEKIKVNLMGCELDGDVATIQCQKCKKNINIFIPQLYHTRRWKGND